MLQSFTLKTNGGEKPPAICLFTDSLEPSGVGEHMLALASQLIATDAILFVCPPTAKGYGVLDRARQLGCQTLALEVRGDRAASAALAKQLRALTVEVFHCHAAADQVGYDVRSLGDGVRGRNVLVIGAGVVGQLTGLFALHHGAANVVITNRTPERLAAAAAMGMTELDETEIEPWRFCKEQWHHGPNDRGADLVFQCRAEAGSLQAALRSLRPQGTVIDLAFYQGGANEVRLGEEFHHNGLAIRCAQINRVPRGLGHAWNRRRLAHATLELLQAYGERIREHIITHVVQFDCGAEFFDDLAASYCSQVLQAVLEAPQAADREPVLAQPAWAEFQPA